MSDRNFREHGRVGSVSIVSNKHGNPCVLIHLPDGTQLTPGTQRLPPHWRYLNRLARQATRKLPHLH